MSCSSHTTCDSCGGNSTLCHWCAFDEACHAVGSIYGCVSGVNCYSIDRCVRTSPESADSLPASLLAVIILSILALCSGCMLTGCLCIAHRVRGAFLDLMPSPLPSSNPITSSGSSLEPVRRPSLAERLTEMKSFGLGAGLGAGKKKKRRSSGPSLDLSDDMDYDLALVENDGNAELSSGGDIQHAYDDSVNRETSTRNDNIDCLYNTCRAGYFIAILAVVMVTSLTLTFWPQVPTYNVCSDELNWGSIVDSMTSLKAGATFQLLVSVYNPNHFDAVVVSGAGVLSHDGVRVGVMNLGEEVSIAATAITDVLMTVTFSSEKWEAAGISAEYYKGTLSFAADADVTVKIPALFGGFTYTADWKNLQIDVGDWGDRSLCACQDWDVDLDDVDDVD